MISGQIRENRLSQRHGKILTHQLEQAVYEFTEDSLRKVLEAGVNVTMIQVGNEVTNGLLWPEGLKPNYDNIARFISSGIRACRAIKPEIPLMIHLDNGGNNEMYRDWFDHYMERGKILIISDFLTIHSGMAPCRCLKTT